MANPTSFKFRKIKKTIKLDSGVSYTVTCRVQLSVTEGEYQVEIEQIINQSTDGDVYPLSKEGAIIMRWLQTFLNQDTGSFLTAYKEM
jgi:hypothetical protein